MTQLSKTNVTYDYFITISNSINEFDSDQFAHEFTKLMKRIRYEQDTTFSEIAKTLKISSSFLSEVMSKKKKVPSKLLLAVVKEYL